QNTGNYSGVNVTVGGVPTPVGQPQTLTVTLKAGDYLWFAEMEDNSGGISGMIIRGLPETTTGGGGTVSIAKTPTGVNITYTGTLQVADKVAGPYADVPGASSPYPATTTDAAKFYRAK